MLNFRKIKSDFSPAMREEGEQLHDDGAVTAAKILELDADSVRITANVRGRHENLYESEIEIDRQTSDVIDSTCDCTYRFDCQHLAALMYHLEERFDTLLVSFSDESGEEEGAAVHHEELQETIQTAKKKESARRGASYERELLSEYASAADLLGSSLFFLSEGELQVDKAEIAVIITNDFSRTVHPEFSIALRLPSRSKPLYIANAREFCEAVRYREPLFLNGRRYFFTAESFAQTSHDLLKTIIESARFTQKSDDRLQKVAQIDGKVFGGLLARCHAVELAKLANSGYVPQQGEKLIMPGIYLGSLEKPLRLSPSAATLRFVVESLTEPAPKLFLKPTAVLDDGVFAISEVLLLECSDPGLLHDGIYYRFSEKLTRRHLLDVELLRDTTIPEPLFGAFVENALPELMRFAEVANQEALNEFVTLPFVGDLKGRCKISYLDGELDASLTFLYDDIEVPAVASQVSAAQAGAFVLDEGILARNLVEERKLIEELFEGFVFNAESGVFAARTEKRIVDFMTEVVPNKGGQVEFDCPQNLLDQFRYDETKFSLKLSEGDRVDVYKVELKVDGDLRGTTLDRIWDAISAKRNFIELERKSTKGKRILVLDIERLKPIIQLLDEVGLKDIDNVVQERPLWSLASIHEAELKKLPIKVTMTAKLREIQKQIMGNRPYEPSPIPEAINAELHGYQVEGVQWLEQLRKMHLSGILADDMGLGKTVQAITAMTQYLQSGSKHPFLVICPTSLVYNWNEEIHRFNPSLKVLVVDGMPAGRKKLIAKATDHDVIVTSYSLLQKDVDQYEKMQLDYLILDEAQHIKNRGTRNAKSVKRLKALHKLILTGTPIENSLDELWSLFDFLMPGLLSSYERFVERYIRTSAVTGKANVETLSRKVAPFILRRMKEDVLADLPPVTETVYYCQLSKVQRELYTSYAASARAELSRLVHKEGFDKVQIHVLATLTRLKQICCHPAVFAKDKAEEGDSAKYDMMLELLHNLIEGKHKTVIFSQYTQMLKIMREDLERLGIRFAYLDGSTKNRMEVVKSFNNDSRIMVFLVSLKAGGTGLNLVGADAVIHFDLWWNPAVQEQATDRVHRLGQDKPVSSLKLVTLGTIEEKVLELQRRKQGLVKQVISADDDVVSKLTWEEVLELLQV